MKNKVTVKNNKKESTNVFLIAQLILSMFAIIFLIISIFEPSFYYAVEIVVSLTLIVMAYNNKTLYKRKYMTIVYGLFGIFLFVSGIIGVLNGRI